MRCQPAHVPDFDAGDFLAILSEMGQALGILGPEPHGVAGEAGVSSIELRDRLAAGSDESPFGFSGSAAADQGAAVCCDIGKHAGNGLRPRAGGIIADTTNAIGALDVGAAPTIVVCARGARRRLESGGDASARVQAQHLDRAAWTRFVADRRDSASSIA